MRYKFIPLLPLSIFIIVCSVAEAHPMPNSVVRLSVMQHVINGEAKMPLLELESAIGHPVQGAIDNAFLRNYFTHHIRVHSRSTEWLTEIEAITLTTDHDRFVGDYSEVTLQFRLIPSDSRYLRHFIFNYDAIIHQVITHKIVVLVQDDWANGLHEETQAQPVGVIELDVPTGIFSPLTIDLEEGSAWIGFLGMIQFGMQHIREGVDHILFLLTLLVIAPLTIQEHRWKQGAGWKHMVSRFFKISLAFTIGHSLTLLTGSFHLFNFHAQYVEILIAFSILLSAVNCIRPVFNNREVLLAAIFGTIHGLAFSTSLSQLDADFIGKLLSILGFNLGIEAMQLIIMVCFFPILLLSKWKFYPTLRTAFALCTIAIAAVWIVERWSIT